MAGWKDQSSRAPWTQGKELNSNPFEDGMRCYISGTLLAICIFLVHGPHLEDRGCREPDSHNQDASNRKEGPNFS